jgi:dTDP-4-amino-4,6-dideoxygalactose transaminase
MIEFEIPFNKPFISGRELEYIGQVHDAGFLSGDGPFSKKCQKWLEDHLGAKKALITPSCTAALEMAAILAEIKPGDEIIMPSFTFVSSANAFVLRGGIPVFVDIHPESLNINESLIEAAITSKTRAIVPVHYAGSACNMDVIMSIANRHDLIVIEDAAQGIMSTYKGQMLGSIGHIGCLSFHETKNIISGEGGALLVNDERFFSRSEIIREKGTDRSKFFRGEIDKYSWQDIGSSYLPSEITCAFLFAQLEKAKEIIDERLLIWQRYNNAFKKLNFEWLELPAIPDYASNNGHIYFLKLHNLQSRDSFIEKMAYMKIKCVFHYVPLHNSIMGMKYCKSISSLKVTEDCSKSLVRLPIWIGMSKKIQNRVIESAILALDEINNTKNTK